MERPTPVSSLLHSSTMVVAGVYLMMLMEVNINSIVLVVVVLSLNIIGHFDVKKNVAYSTSIHLLLMLMLGVMGMNHAVVLYIILHRIIKRQIFQGSGYGIHGVGSQDMREYVANGICYIICVGIFLLSAVVGVVIVRAKELVVLGSLGVMVIILVVVSYIYTLHFVNKVMMRG